MICALGETGVTFKDFAESVLFYDKLLSFSGPAVNFSFASVSRGAGCANLYAVSPIRIGPLERQIRSVASTPPGTIFAGL